MSNYECRAAIFFHCLIVLSLLLACSEPPPPSLSLKDRQLVDSLYQIEYEAIVDSLDKDCTRLQTEQLEVIVDSLIKVRLVEIEMQKRRFRQKRSPEKQNN